MDYEEDMPSVGFLTRWTVVASGLLGLSAVLVTSIPMTMAPAWMGLHREVQKQSHQYVDAKESMLTQWISEYNRLDTEALKYDDAGKPELARSTRLQQASLLARIQTEAQRIPAGAIPQNISFFLETHQ